MKYIARGNDSYWDLIPYERYISQSKADFPIGLQDYLTTIEVFDIMSKNSLHDSNLLELTISEPCRTHGTDKERNRISIKLLGAYRDREFHITYLNVVDYNITTEGPTWITDGSVHGDLIIDEITLNKDNSISHEIVFRTGKHLDIIAMDISVEIKFYE